MKRILLTGYGGFIGNSIYQRISLKNNSTFIMSCIEKDYMNKKFWKKSLDNTVQQCDIILHVGAISDTMLEDNNKMMKYNYEFSKVLFDLAEKNNKQVVYSSSAANDGDDGLPSNFYGWSKYITEQYGMSKVTNFIALRYFNVYGPGEEHKKKMASVALQAYNLSKLPFTTKFKLFPGEPTRDFVYIDDVVDATLFPLFNNVSKGIYHVGTGQSRTFEDVLDLMNIDYIYRKQKDIPSGYQYYTIADKNKFMEGWDPKYNIEQGLKKYMEYLK
jgi:ADP-L-glycero-D-manno-heptose 6-epimerase